jgi:pimeloyl-ACP methyl ester carboxylesterase
VILLPGLGASAFTYRHQLPALGAAGFHATAVDLKGHGFSDKPTGRGEYTFDAMYRHVEDVVEAIAPGPVILVAQSMAGAVAFELALTRGRLVPRLVLISPVGFGVIRFIRLARLLTPRSLDHVAPLLVRRTVVRTALGLAYADSRRVTSETVEEYFAPAQFPGFARALRALVHDFRWAPMPEKRLAELDVPTLVVLGSRDRIVRDARRRAARLPSARAVVVGDGGHAVNEERPEQVNAEVLDFLRDASTANAANAR